MNQASGQSEFDYGYSHARSNPSHSYLWAFIKQIASDHTFNDRRAIDVGCGNGATAGMLKDLGFDVLGVDPSESGISQAKKTYPGVTFQVDSAYEDLASKYGNFEFVVSLEVAEHLYDPHKFVRVLHDLLAPDGLGLVSTPYHGYWKNLALAIAGRWDRHHNPLRLGGHIKFFSKSSLLTLLESSGFKDVDIARVGRIPPLAKSMIATFRKQPPAISK